MPGLPDVSGFRCRECGAFRVNTTEHSVCPNGHGRLHPKLRSVDLAAIAVSEVPVVRTEKRGVHFIGDTRVKFVKRFGIRSATRRIRGGEKSIARCEAFRSGFGSFVTA